MGKSNLTGLGLFAAGAGLGAVVALLYAPRAGKHTRRRIANSANRTLHEIGGIRDDVRDSMSEWVGETTESIASGVASARDTLKEGGENVRNTLAKVRERVEDGCGRVEKYVRSVAG
jgi:gas vesicle protein